MADLWTDNGTIIIPLNSTNLAAPATAGGRVSDLQRLSSAGRRSRRDVAEANSEAYVKRGSCFQEIVQGVAGLRLTPGKTCSILAEGREVTLAPPLHRVITVGAAAL